jgi:hypothetical protein
VVPEWIKVLAGSLALMIGASAPALITEGLQWRQHYRPEVYRPPEQNPATSADAAKQANPPKETSDQSTAINPSVPAPHHQKEGGNQGNRSEQEGSESYLVVAGYRLKITDFAVALFTGLLVLVGYIQAVRLRKTITTMESAERRQTRAYVGINDIRFDFLHISDTNWKAPDPLPTSGYIYEDKILVTVKNFGETPAYELRIVVNWQLLAPFGVHPPADYSFPEHAPVVPVTSSEVLDKGHIFTGTINVGDMHDF